MKANAPLTRRRVLKVLREHRDDLRQFNVKSIALFGSYAKGRPQPASDLDFVVEFVEPTYDNFIRLSGFLEKLFRRKVDILTPAGVASIRVPQIAKHIQRTMVHV